MKATANARQLIDIDLPWLLTKAELDDALSFYEWLEEECIRTNDWSPYAALGRGDRYFLILRILNRTDVVHPGKRGDWLYERCREVENDPDGYLDLWAREHYKSSFITFTGSIQEILKNSELTIGIFSHTRPAAKAFLSQIARELEQNEKLKFLYPDVLWANPRKEAAKWSLDDGIVVKRKGNPKEQSIEAWGLVDGQPTGKHFKLLIFDDVVTKESVSTPEQIQKATKAWELAQHLGIQKGGRSWHIGTRYAHHDTYAQLLEREAVKPRVHPATEDGTFDGKPVFLTDEEWSKKNQESSEETIAAQMLLNPSAGTLQELKPEWLRPYELRPETLNVYIMGDYAGSRKSTGSSNTAIAVVGVDYANNKYLIDGACHKMDLDERWTRIRDLRKKWLRQKGIQIVDVGYERFGAQSDIEHFETMMKIEGEAFSIKELAWPSEGSVSKDNRIRRLIPDLKNWRFFFPHQSHLPTAAQVRAKNEGRSHLIAQPIKQKNHEGKWYDVIDWFVRNEYLFFPNTTQKDFLDATSRVYDMDVNGPMVYQESDLAPEEMTDDYDPAM